MSKTLTVEQISAVESAALDSFKFENDAIRAALVRLDFLERKLAAAEALALEVHVYVDSDGAMSDCGMSFLLKDYREVVE
jgi:hypothetical protein